MKRVPAITAGAAMLAALLVTAASAPALAAPPETVHRATRAAGEAVSQARDAAIHDCSVAASKWSFSSWQSTQIITYEDCMAEHGQMP